MIYLIFVQNLLHTLKILLQGCSYKYQLSMLSYDTDVLKIHDLFLDSCLVFCTCGLQACAMLPEEALEVALSHCNMLEILNIHLCPKVSIVAAAIFLDY